MPSFLLQSQFIEACIKLGMPFEQAQVVSFELLHLTMISDVVQPAMKDAYEHMGDSPEAPQK